MDPDPSKGKWNFSNLPTDDTSDNIKTGFGTSHIVLLTILIVMGLILAILIKPAITGYVVATDFNQNNMNVSDFIKEQESIKSDLTMTETNLDSCKKLNQDYLEQLSNEKNAGFQCSQETEALKSELRQQEAKFSFNITQIAAAANQKNNEMEIKVQQSETKYNELKELYDSIIGNVAHNICCKAKVDNGNIDSYLISNSMIVCTSGSDNKIDC